MKKITWISFLMATLPMVAMAQSEDDMYFTPKKKTVVETPQTTKEIRISGDKVEVKTNAPTKIIVRDAKGRVRDVDEYNRRYSSKQYGYNVENDTLYIDEKVQADLDGEWVNDFEGSADDYEYATRIIRFRNPRYAIPISSPLYWDVVYGLDSWNWNVYYDDFYAYAFPTFSNRLWWNWRFGPSWNWGWNGYYGGYYGGWYAGWNHGWNYGWCGGPYYGWGGYHHHNPHYVAWGGSGWRGSSRQRFAGNAGPRSRVASRGDWGGRGIAGSRDGRYSRSVIGSRSGNYTQDVRSARVGGRVVTSRSDNNASVRSSRGSVVGSRSDYGNNVNSDASVRSRSVYNRQQNGSYSRPSSTRSSVYSNDRGSSVRSSEGSARSSRSSSERSYTPSRSSERSSSSFNSSSRSISSSFSGSSRGGGSFGGGSRGGNSGGSSRGGRR